MPLKDNKTTDRTSYAWAFLRFALGFMFLWAFFDKLFGFGFATCRNPHTNVVSVMCSQSWLKGGSPTSGFLSHAVQGPFASFYHNLAGSGLVDWLFMLGLLGVGLSLITGIATRLASIVGMIMVFLMWTALLWPADNPVIDEHFVYFFIFLGIYLNAGNQKWSLAGWWSKRSFAKQLPGYLR